MKPRMKTRSRVHVLFLLPLSSRTVDNRKKMLLTIFFSVVANKVFIASVDILPHWELCAKSHQEGFPPSLELRVETRVIGRAQNDDYDYVGQNCRMKLLSEFSADGVVCSRTDQISCSASSGR